MCDVIAESIHAMWLAVRQMCDVIAESIHVMWLSGSQTDV